MKKNKLISSIAFVTLFFCFSFYAYSQPEMVKDINALGDSDPSNLNNASGFLYFSSDDGVNGTELWRSNGNGNGTIMVKDINPGAAGSDASNFLTDGYTTYFTANDGVIGEELWKTDGTESGTILVKDINPGSGNSNLSDLVLINGILYFSAYDGSNGSELWKSNGTASGTTMVKDIRSGSSSSYPSYLIGINDTLYFSAWGSEGTELWKSDGTEAGTILVKDILPGSSGSSPNYLVNLNDALYFKAYDGSNGSELWKSDGTDIGTIMVKDIRPGSSASYPEHLTNINGTLYFAANDGVNGTELWKSDGSELGTEMVMDIRPGSSSGYPKIILGISDTLFFEADDGTNGKELWKSDGTEANTIMVKDIYPGTGPGISYADDYFECVGNTIFFRANDGTNGTELWKTDGTEPGTVMVEDTVSGSLGSNPEYLKAINGTLFYSADYNQGFGRELWKLDYDQSPPIPYFKSDIVSGNAALMVNFTDMSASGGGTITNWNWDFGDGNFSIDQNPTHTYNDFGYHTVSLTIINDLGIDSTLNRTDYIYVDSIQHVIHIPIEQPTIQAGIDIAVVGDTVLVEPGIYSGFGNINLDYMGKGILVASKVGRDSTFIDCANTSQGFYFHSEEDSTSILDGFTILNGYASNGGGIQIEKSSPTIKNMMIDTSYADINGGGIYVDSSNVIFQNIKVYSNTADYGGGMYIVNSDVTLDTLVIMENTSTYNSTAKGGGGIYCGNSNLIIQNTIISSNKSRYRGGGVFCDDTSNMQICNVELNSNIATAGASSSGCGIYIKSSVANISNTDIENHTAVNGAGLFASDSECNIDTASFTDNYANSGAGIYLINSTGILNGITLTNCDVGNEGGGLFLSNFIGNISNVFVTDGMASRGSGVYMEDCHDTHFDSLVLINNYCVDGALYIEDSEPIISDLYIDANNGHCIFIESSDPIISKAIVTSGNYGIKMRYSDPIITDMIINDNLKGIYCYYSKPVLSNIEITNNFSNTPGGGIEILYSSLARLNNVTISDNIAIGNGGAVYIENSVAIIENSILHTNLPDEIYIESGGVNVTYSNITGGYNGIGNFDIDPIFNDPANGDYSLSINSPCIDMGNPSSTLDPDGTRTDIGAYYFDHSQPAGPCPTITSIADVPNDEGGFVVINWDASAMDVAQYQGIIHYSVWREQDWADSPWEFIDYVPAQFFSEYAFIAPTISDSTENGTPYYKYMITAETNYTGVFYQSQSDSGFSVDNLAPEVPDGLYGVISNEQVHLWWNTCPNPDFNHFNIYRYNSGNELGYVYFGSTYEVNFMDVDIAYDTLAYFITAVDISGNESASSENLIFSPNHENVLDIKVFLEGPYKATSMDISLNTEGKLPLSQPYNTEPWNYAGNEAVLAFPYSEIVDWVLVEFRDASEAQYASASTMINRQAAFLLSDGSIVGIDGVSYLQLGETIQHDLFIVVHHRNHLSILSSFSSIETNGIYSYDFSTGMDQAFGNDSQKALGSGNYGMIGGDGDANGMIDSNDKTPTWIIVAGEEGYNAADYNLDGQINNQDKDEVWLINMDSHSQVPE